MPGFRVRALFVAALVAALLPSGTVSAGGPGTWDRVTALDQVNIDEPALHRTPDGLLHIFWVRHDEDNEDLLRQIVKPGGAKGELSGVTQNWEGIQDPDVVGVGDGMRVFFGGIQSGAEGETNNNLNTASTLGSDEPWTLQPTSVVVDESAYASQIGAARSQDGAFFQSWDAGAELFVHRGLSPSSSIDYQGQFGECCGHQPDIGTDGDTGVMFVVWYSGAADHRGVYAHRIDPASGEAVGSARRMPGTVTQYFGSPASLFMNARTPVAGRRNRSGVYVAYTGGYPTAKKVLLWRIGADASTVIAQADRKHDDVGIAADPQGRLWVMWTEEPQGTPVIYARRSNPTVTGWGPRISVAAPSGASEVWKLVGNAQSDRLDVVGMITVPAGLAGFHTQLRPGLTLTASPQKFSGQRQVTFTVTDAKTPVGGAVVSAGGKSDTTNVNGVATITLGPYDTTKKITAAATKPGFVKDTVVVTVSPPA